MPHVEILAADPEPYLVSAESPEELVMTAFDLLVGRIGDRRARELWKNVLKRRIGRPSNSIKYNSALYLPGIRRFAREMPHSSLTQVITAFVKDMESNGLKRGASTDATIRRLVRDYRFLRKHGHFPRDMMKNND